MSGKQIEPTTEEYQAWAADGTEPREARKDEPTWPECGRPLYDSYEHDGDGRCILPLGHDDRCNDVEPPTDDDPAVPRSDEPPEPVTRDWFVCSSCNGLVPEADATIICVECGDGMAFTANAAASSAPAGDGLLREAALTVLEALRPRRFGPGMRHLPTLRYDSPSIGILRAALASPAPGNPPAVGWDANDDFDSAAPAGDGLLREALPTLRRALGCLRAGAYDDAADDLADLIAALASPAPSPEIDVEGLARAMFEEGIAPFRSRSKAEAHGFEERYRRNARDLIRRLAASPLSPQTAPSEENDSALEDPYPPDDPDPEIDVPRLANAMRAWYGRQGDGDHPRTWIDEDAPGIAVEYRAAASPQTAPETEP